MSTVKEKVTHTATIKSYYNDEGKYKATSVKVSIPEKKGCLELLLVSWLPIMLEVMQCLTQTNSQR